MKIILSIVFLIRFFLSLISYNGDLNNHFAWTDSMMVYGYRGLYERDVSPWAAVNYPPLTLYSFALSEKLFRILPDSLQTYPVRASLYKIPNILADCLLAWLIWRYTTWSKKAKLLAMAASLLNPALAYNSIWWGQVEPSVAFASVLSLFLFARGRPGHALVTFVIALLLKQNALPLIPVIGFAVLLTKPSMRQLVGAALVSLCLAYFAYVPFVPHGNNVLMYAASQYISSVGGQPHQHEASVNALNYWYLVGGNHVLDSQTLYGPVTLRQISSVLTLVGVGLGLFVGWHYRRNALTALLTSSSLISLWTFVFTTRMHERHSYFAIALLCLLVPVMKRKAPFVVLSLISFYNLFGVWSEYFNFNRGMVGWENWTRFLSLVVVVITLSFPLWLLPRTTDTRVKLSHQ